VITLWIDWWARNRFLVFTGTLVLLLAALWTMRRIPLDALPDISDVQVIIHTAWNGEPPNIIEDQVTYPIVTALLAAPHVKAVRAQTMFGDSYVFVVFEDGTDLFGLARVFWSTSSRSGDVFPLRSIRRSVPTRPAQAGSMNI
jgi:copper/silver efflux system protein